METMNLLNTFLISFASLWLFLFLLTLYQANRSRLLRKGYPEASVPFIRKTHIRRNTGIAIMVPLLGVASAFIVWAVTGDLAETPHVIAVLLLWLVLIIPFPILDYRKSAREARELALRTQSPIVIDLNFTILHLIFRPYLEVACTVLYLLYFLLFVGFFHVAFIHVALLWTLYGAARFGKNLTAPALRDAYFFLFVFIILNQAILILHLIREWRLWYDCCAPGIVDLHVLAGFLLTVVLGGKLIYYLTRFPEFRARLAHTTP